MKKLALAALMTLGSAEASAVSQPQPVLVEFDGLLWIQSSDGLPYIKNGQILAPLRPLCALFGAKCTPDWVKKTVDVKQAGQPSSFPAMPIEDIRWKDGHKVAFVSLQKMAGPLGYAPVRWIPDAQRVNVQRLPRTVGGGLSRIQSEFAGLKMKPTHVAAPVKVFAQQLPGQPEWETLFVSSPAQMLAALWPYYRTEYGQTSYFRPSDCVGKYTRTCTLNTQKDWLYTLAYTQMLDGVAQ